MYHLLQNWRSLPPEAALELLDHQYADIQVASGILQHVAGSDSVLFRCVTELWSGWNAWGTTNSLCTYCS